MDLTALKSELAGDHPVTGSYSADDTEAAGQLNVVNCTRPRDTMTGSEILNAITVEDYTSLEETEKLDMWRVVHLGTINPHGAEAELLARIFGIGSVTITRLAAARQQPVSRAVELGLGEIFASHVTQARVYHV